MKIIYYYQTLVGLQPILNEQELSCTHIILSSIHFGKNKDGSPYIHLNNYPPQDSRFVKCWDELRTLSERGVTIMIMMGGAGGAYRELFSNYIIYYNLLKELIRTYDFIKGIDIDIEEQVQLNNVKELIQNLTTDFGKEFIITMAPLGGSLMNDEPGMGGFVYKDLYKSEVGSYINWFNGQYYDSYSISDMERTIQNGYPPEKVVMGMVSGQFPDKNLFNIALITIKNIKEKYPNFGGVDVWEYVDSPPGNKTDPSLWSKEIKNI